jgi:hypothetical protein
MRGAGGRCHPAGPDLLGYDLAERTGYGSIAVLDWHCADQPASTSADLPLLPGEAGDLGR